MKCVYLIKLCETNHYKIGVTKDIVQRLTNLKTSSPDKVLLINVFYSEYAFKIEKTLHSLYSHCNTNNEWFELYIEDEVNFIKKCENIEKNLKYLDENKI